MKAFILHSDTLQVDVIYNLPKNRETATEIVENIISNNDTFIVVDDDETIPVTIKRWNNEKEQAEINPDYRPYIL